MNLHLTYKCNALELHNISPITEDTALKKTLAALLSVAVLLAGAVSAEAKITLKVANSGPDTPENRTLLESVANNPNNYLGTDTMNTQWYAQIQSDGSQIWARVWNGSIFNGGINEVPREWNPVTGLNNNPFG